jgi:hypothetical protein
MDIKKFLVGTLVGGIAFFLVGYLFYGVVLERFFAEHTAASSTSMKTMSDIVWWALVLGNFASGALLTYVFLKWTNISTFKGGFGGAAAIGFFLTLSRDMIRFATEGSFDLTASLGDVVVGTVMTAFAGGIVGAVLGMGKN